MAKMLIAMLMLFLVAPSAMAQEQTATQENTRISFFKNVSGVTITSGYAMVFDVEDSNLTTGTSYGASASSRGLAVDFTVTADNRLFAGVLYDNACPDDAVCRFVTYGPALVMTADSTDPQLTKGGALGTTTVRGMLGSGTLAGVLLSDGVNGPADGSDGVVKWMWVNPDN